MINSYLRPHNTPILLIPGTIIDVFRMFSTSYIPPFLPFIISQLPSYYEYYLEKSINSSKDKPLLVLAHFGNNAFYAKRISKKLKIPLFVYFYGFDVTVLLKKCPKYYTYIERDIEAGFVTSYYLCQRLLEYNFNRPIYLNRLGLDLTRYIFNPECASISNRRTVTVISVGRLVEVKGHEYLIAACNILIKKGYNVKTIIIGDGPRKNILSNLIKKLGLSDRVKLIGRLPHEEVLKYLYNSNIFVFPSISCRDGSTEALGYACVEAMACGLPVVASNVGGIPEYVINDQTGLLVEQRSPKQIAEAIEELINNPKKAKRLSRNARKIVEHMFDISRNISKLELTFLKYISE
ncbi:MAG: glycosyltransferase family 4 protein [Thermofilaceae archaeon]